MAVGVVLLLLVVWRPGCFSWPEVRSSRHTRVQPSTHYSRGVTPAPPSPQDVWRLKIHKGGRVMFEVAVEYVGEWLGAAEGKQNSPRSSHTQGGRAGESIQQAHPHPLNSTLTPSHTRHAHHTHSTHNAISQAPVPPLSPAAQRASGAGPSASGCGASPWTTRSTRRPSTRVGRCAALAMVYRDLICCTLPVPSSDYAQLSHKCVSDLFV